MSNEKKDTVEPVPTDALPPPPPREKPMGFFEHLEELRGTLVKSIVAFILCAIVIGVFIKGFFDALQWPLHHVALEYTPPLNVKLQVIKVMEVFTMLIQMCVMGGLVMSLPFILYFVGQFVAPALTEKEMKAVLPMCISALILFLVGAAFGFFFLMPATIRVAVELNSTFGFTVGWTVGDYISTLSWLVLGVGAAFEFPLVIVILVWMGVLTTTFLKKYRRHAIIVIFIIAAIITPTPEPVTQTAFALPLYALYELAIIVSRGIEKKRELARAMG